MDFEKMKEDIAQKTNGNLLYDGFKKFQNVEEKKSHGFLLMRVELYVHIVRVEEKTKRLRKYIVKSI